MYAIVWLIASKAIDKNVAKHHWLVDCCLMQWNFTYLCRKLPAYYILPYKLLFSSV